MHIEQIKLCTDQWQRISKAAAVVKHHFARKATKFVICCAANQNWQIFARVFLIWKHALTNAANCQLIGVLWHLDSTVVDLSHHQICKTVQIQNSYAMIHFEQQQQQQQQLTSLSGQYSSLQSMCSGPECTNANLLLFAALHSCNCIATDTFITTCTLVDPRLTVTSYTPRLHESSIKTQSQ